MQIFLQILAVIGIILLCAIGLVLVVLGLVLFVPLRYKIKAHKDNEIVAQAQVTWLLHFFSIKYMYPEPGEIAVRVLGKKVWKMKPGGEQEEETDRSEDEKKEAQAVKDDNKVSNVKKKGQEEKKLEPVVPSQNESTDENVKNIEVQKPEVNKKDENKTEEKENVFKKIQCKIKHIYDKMKKILSDYEYYRDLLQEKENRLLFERCKLRIFKILKHIKPRVLKADVLVGTGEPDTTGYLMAVYGMLIPILGNDIILTPDFDKKIFEGSLYAKGRITLFTLLYNGIRIYFDDQLHLLIDKLKRKDV